MRLLLHLCVLFCPFVVCETCVLDGNWIFFNGTAFPGTTTTSVGVEHGTDSNNFVATVSQQTWHGTILKTGDYVDLLLRRDADGLVLEGTVAYPACNRICWNCTQTPKGAGSGLVWRVVKPETTHVHLVFMTHLDVGYTQDTSLQVIDQYFSEWFPKAYDTAKQLKERGGEEQFAWTTHPWLINRFLANATGTVSQDDINALKQAIAEDAITWHAGPMNMQAEVSERELFNFGLTLAHELDRQFNKSLKIGMSQKDVPGTTIGIVSLMRDNGIRSLHVGVNDFSTPPAVPDSSPAMYAPCNAFKWLDPRDPLTAEIIAFWCSGYGEGYGDDSGLVPEMTVALPPLTDNSLHELAYLMRVDNTGPQSVDEVLEGWKNARLLYPNAAIELSSLDRFTAIALRPEVLNKLPVLTKEIGDTWIRGTGSDPTKIRRFRAAARVMSQQIASHAVTTSDPRVFESMSNLIKLAEHTYGPNDGLVWAWPYDNPSFKANVGTDAYNRTVAGFMEQRTYLTKAVDALTGNLSPVRQKVLDAIQASEPVVGGLNSEVGVRWMKLPRGPPFRDTCSGVSIGFDSTGAINELSFGGRQWANANHTLALFQYRSHSEWEFDSFGAEYMLPGCRAEQDCGLCAFGKCKLSSDAHAETKGWLPKVVAAYKSFGLNETCQYRFSLEFSDPEALNKYGAPTSTNVTFSVVGALGQTTANVAVDLQFEKPPTRMAESVWLSFNPANVQPSGWRLDKLGSVVSPFDVVVNGSRFSHSVWSGIYYYEGSTRGPEATQRPKVTPQAGLPKATLAICTLDAPVVMIDQPTPILFLRDAPVNGSSFHFNLFNNAWNTNFPVWLLDPLQRFRFDISLSALPTSAAVCTRSL